MNQPKLKPLFTRIPAKLHTQVKVAAAQQGASVQDYVIAALTHSISQDSVCDTTRYPKCADSLREVNHE